MIYPINDYAAQTLFAPQHPEQEPLQECAFLGMTCTKKEYHDFLMNLARQISSQMVEDLKRIEEALKKLNPDHKED